MSRGTNWDTAMLAYLLIVLCCSPTPGKIGPERDREEHERLLAIDISEEITALGTTFVCASCEESNDRAFYTVQGFVYFDVRAARRALERQVQAIPATQRPVIFYWMHRDLDTDTQQGRDDEFFANEVRRIGHERRCITVLQHVSGYGWLELDDYRRDPYKVVGAATQLENGVYAAQMELWRVFEETSRGRTPHSDPVQWTQAVEPACDQVEHKACGQLPRKRVWPRRRWFR